MGIFKKRMFEVGKKRFRSKTAAIKYAKNMGFSRIVEVTETFEIVPKKKKRRK